MQINSINYMHNMHTYYRYKFWYEIAHNFEHMMKVSDILVNSTKFCICVTMFYPFEPSKLQYIMVKILLFGIQIHKMVCVLISQNFYLFYILLTWKPSVL